jgi:GT2 family glycosyltransferase
MTLNGVPRVSVIIPHLNTPDRLAACLASVIGQSLDHGTAEIIVVDNGSRLPLDAVQAAAPLVRFLKEPKPGPGLARNHGVAAASAPIIAFIDADCTAAKGWLQAAVNAVEADPATAVIGGDIRIALAQPPRMTGIEAYESVFGFRQQMYIERKHFSATANMAMARPVFEAVGPFGGIEIAEDLDWGQRAHAAGYPVRYVPAMQVWHPARESLAALESKWRRHIRHDWTVAQTSRSGRIRWGLRALALMASGPLEAPRLLLSSRLQGLGNRLRGIDTLLRIRAFRAAEMLRIRRAMVDHAHPVWNRE